MLQIPSQNLKIKIFIEICLHLYLFSSVPALHFWEAVLLAASQYKYAPRNIKTFPNSNFSVRKILAFKGNINCVQIQTI